MVGGLPVQQGEVAGTRIGHYLVDRVLGSGGMGVVYLATSPSGRRAAVKVIRDPYVADEKFRVRFAREVAAARAVSGAFTAPVIDAETSGDMPWMATLYVEGPSLADHVAQEGPMPADAVWQLASGLAEALRDIHRADLVHRDLKPGNILMADDGPRVIDFGISRAMASEGITQTGAVIGTPPFMAPEQFRTPKELTNSADVFAFGSVLVYAATGRSPFEGETAYAVAWNVVHEPPDLQGVPDSLLPVVNACLEKEASARPTAEQLLELLGSRAYRRRSATPRKRRRTARLRLAGVASTLALLITGSVWVVSQRSDPPPTKPDKAAAPRSAARPVHEPAAALQPKGWALWETSVRGNQGPEDPESADMSTCLLVGDGLICMGDTGGVFHFAAANGEDITPRALKEMGDDAYMMRSAPEARLAYLIRHEEDTAPGPQSPATLYAYDPERRTIAWKQRMPEGIDGAVHVGEQVLTFTATDTIQAWNATTGSEKWTRRVSGTESLFIRGAAAVLTAGAEQDPTPGFQYVNPEDGSTIWRHRGLHHAGAIGETSDTLIVSVHEPRTRTQRIVQLAKRDGETVNEPIGLNSRDAVTLAEDKLVVLRNDGLLRALDLVRGKEVWSQPSGGDPREDLLVQDGRVYVQLLGGDVLCRDVATGKELWRSAVRRDPNDDPRDHGGTVHTLAVRGDTVFTTSARHSVFAIRPPKSARPGS
ncbi:serine/threonine protein kinase [Streptomyces pristinaespiralis ATCC 25486]|uniref:Serine/threonine protein kinase n=2 Tax=Streptomyces pristinaespiralis TaxID=38300 RepID=B5HAI9_STRE2